MCFRENAIEDNICPVSPHQSSKLTAYKRGMELRGSIPPPGSNFCGISVEVARLVSTQ